MPITPFPITPLERDDSFDPDLVHTMSVAFRQACFALGLLPQPDPFTVLVANHIIKCARCGMQSKTALYTSAVLEFRGHPQ